MGDSYPPMIAQGSQTLPVARYFMRDRDAAVSFSITTIFSPTVVEEANLGLRLGKGKIVTLAGLQFRKLSGDEPLSEAA